MIMRLGGHCVWASVQSADDPGGQPELPGTVTEDGGGSPVVWGWENNKATFRAYCSGAKWMAGVRGKLYSKTVHQTSKGTPVSVSKPFRVVLPYPASCERRKYQVCGSRSVSINLPACARGQTFGDHSPPSLPVLNKPPILQSLPVPLCSSVRTQSRFPNIWFADPETQLRWPVATGLGTTVGQ